MRTRVRCGWLVGHADGHHTLWRDAELVFQDHTILFVGERFAGEVDREQVAERFEPVKRGSVELRRQTSCVNLRAE